MDAGLSNLHDEFIASFKGEDAYKSIEELLNSLPYFAAILNSNRQAVFVNHDMITKLGFNSLESLLGRRPGEILSCIHSLDNNNQCGLSDSCRYCGAYQSIKHTLLNQAPSSSEFRVTTKINNNIIAQEFMVTTTPLILNDKVYMILHLNDISHEIRRKMLERIFFHDAINKISSLYGFIELMKEEDSLGTIKEHIAIASQVIKDLSDEIMAQRELSAAENGELIVRKTKVKSLEIVEKVINQIKNLEIAKNIEIEIYQDSSNVEVLTDVTLLNRVITNMLKNAVEASIAGDTVSASVCADDNIINFSVHNKAYIPRDVQLQIFQRSFSTKGENRGIGTYSIKLLTERYLKGNVQFVSDKEKGTTFFIEIFR